MANGTPHTDGLSLKLLGQEVLVSSTWQAMVTVCISTIAVMVTIVLVLLILGTKGAVDIANVFAGTSDKHGNLSQEIGTIMEFWTPSPDTRRELERTNEWEFLPKERKEWYETTEDGINAFTKDLRASRIDGYARWAAWGQHTGPLKIGYQWSITIAKGSSFNVKELLRLYREHFKRDSGIYIEIRHTGEFRHDAKK